MIDRLYRWRRRVLLPLAALPLLQTTGCPDPFALGIQTGTSLGSSLTQSIITSAAGAILQIILTSFAGSNFLRAFLGGGGS